MSGYPENVVKLQKLQEERVQQRILKLKEACNDCKHKDTLPALLSGEIIFSPCDSCSRIYDDKYTPND